MANHNAGKRRSLGLAITTSLVLGNMVGSGVFLLPASLAPYGSYSLWGWGLSAVGAIMLAWVFSRLARRLPRAGGPYAYTHAGFGEFMGFLIAWGYWLCILASNAAIAVAMASYLAAFFPALSARPLLGALAALSAVWLLTVVNIIGVRTAGSVQLVTTILKLTPLLALAFFGALHFDPGVMAAATTDATPLAAVNTCAALTLWAFLGLESATIPADHVRDPEKTIPRATLLGTLIAAAFYIVCTTVVMGIVPTSALATSNAPFADAAQMLWGDWAGYFIAGAAVIACFGTLNGWILLQGQLPEAIAKDRLFPGFFARESRFATPALGLVVSSVLVSILIALNYTRGLVPLFTFIIQIATLSTLIPYLFCAMADMILGRREQQPRTKRIRDNSIAAGAFVFSLWAIAGTGQEAVYWGVLLLLAGVPLYVWQTGRKVRNNG